MRAFDYQNIPDELLHHELMNLVSAIHEYKGKQDVTVQSPNTDLMM